jgi:hypothetical protein
MFPVRYEISLYIIFTRNSAFKGLKMRITLILPFRVQDVIYLQSVPLIKHCW